MDVFQSFYDILNLFDKLSPEDKIDFKEIQKYLLNDLKENHGVDCLERSYVFHYHDFLRGMVESFHENKGLSCEERRIYLLKRFYPKYYPRTFFDYLFSCKSFATCSIVRNPPAKAPADRVEVGDAKKSTPAISI